MPAAVYAEGAAARALGEDEALGRLRVRLEEVLSRRPDVAVTAEPEALRVVSRQPRGSVRNIPSASRDASGRARPGAKPPEPGSWSYSGATGPEHWARLDSAWASCGADIPQSPIDVRDGIPVSLAELDFDLPPAELVIRDDGRAIHAVVGAGPAIGALGRRFSLREIRFHQPAEFRVDGRAYDLSAHLLHYDDYGRIAIVVVLFEVGDDSTPRNPVLQAVLADLPLSPDMAMPVSRRIDLDALLPEERGYYNFVGTLSVPPCTPGVVWMVLREPVRIPPSQVAIFARLHPGNVRPLQPLAGRLIKQSE